MDHLVILDKFGGHKICYDTPRICNVSNDDFKFVMTADMNDENMEEFGRLPVCYSFLFLFLIFCSSW